MHGETAKSQGENFQEAPVGDLFFLCHGNDSLPLVGQFTSMPEPCDKGDGWLQRRYRVLKPGIKQGGYQGGQKGWTPNYRSTFKQVPAHDLPEFETALLKPFSAPIWPNWPRWPVNPLKIRARTVMPSLQSRQSRRRVRRVSMERLASTASTTAHPARAKPTR